MKKITLLLLLTLLAIHTLTAQIQTKKRDLKNYQSGAVFDLKGDFLGKANEAKKSLRIYLWDLWNNKDQVYFKVFYYTREGDKVICTYFVENSEINSRQIVEECVSSQCPYVSEKACRKIKPAERIFNKVEKVKRRKMLPSGKFVTTDEDIIILSNSTSQDKTEF